MLVANRTVPHYHPVTKMSSEEIENWYTSSVNGLGVPAAAMTALQDEVGDPSELLGLTDADVKAIQRNLSTREINADGKAKPTYKLSNRVLIRLKGDIKLVNYLSMVRRDIYWEQLKWTNLGSFVYDWNALVAISEKVAGDPLVWKRGYQAQTVPFLTR